MRHEAQAPRRRASAAGARHPVGGRLPPSSGAGGHRLSFLTAFSVQIHALPLLLGCAAAALAFLGLWSLPRRWWALPLALLAAAWVLAAICSAATLASAKFPGGSVCTSAGSARSSVVSGCGKP